MGDPYYTPAHLAALQSAESGRAVINAGNLGAAYQLDMTGHHDVLIVGTLTANCTITVTGETPGCRYSFQLTQDATGGRTVTFPAAVQPAGPLAVNATALVTSVVQFDYDGTNRIAWSSVMGTLDSLATKRVVGATGTAGAATASGSAITATAVALGGKPTPNDFVGAFRLTMKSTGMATGTLTTVTRSVAAGHAGLVILQPLNAAAIAAQMTPNTFSNGQTFDVVAGVAPVASSVIDFSYQYVE